MSKLISPVSMLVALIPLAATLSCGGTPARQPGLDLGASGTSWAAKSREERMGYMAGRIEPFMRQLFVQFDNTTDDFGCATCHSTEMELVDFKMPIDDLYALPTENTIAAAREYDAEVTQFMVDKVVPAMSKLLNTGRGPKHEVTCFSCHPSDS